MKKLTREECPPALLRLAEAEMAKAKLHFDDVESTGTFEFKAYSHREVKSALSKMTKGNCAYCEADYDTTAPVDVEHFRPKGEIKTENEILTPGYWWLAASWDNLLPSCIRCNREEIILLFDGTEVKAGKGNRFPLNDEDRRARAIGEEENEAPLLIDPCRENPADFIRFEDIDGRCIAVPVENDPTSLSARRARKSIDIYGLNRAGLVRARSDAMVRAKLSLSQLQRAARRLNRLVPDQEQDIRETEIEIDEHLKSLAEFVSGLQPYSGVLDAIIRPVLANLNIVLTNRM